MRKFLYLLAQFEILAICGVLIGAFWVQFVNSEYPCPLCILQRMALILSALGPALIVMRGIKGRDIEIPTVLAGYGMSILGAVVGLVASLRQVLEHILPGEEGYGSAVMGLHLYSWAFIVFLVVLAFSGTRLLLFHSIAPHPTTNRWTARAVLWLFGLVIAANIVAVFFEAGLHAFLPDNPTSYRLIDGP
jgi:disulfide bond formation protein DsbB